MSASHSFDDVPSRIDHYRLQFGYVLPNGNLSISVSGETEDGVRVDGRVEVALDQPEFDKWRAIVARGREPYEEMKHQRNKERAERREQAGLSKTQDNTEP